MTGATAAGPMTPLQYLETIARWVRDEQGGKPMTWAHVAFVSLEYALRDSSWRKEPQLRKLRDEMRETLGRVFVEPASRRLDSSLPAAAERLAQYEKGRDVSRLLLHERFLSFLAARPVLGNLNDSTVNLWRARLDAHGLAPEHFEGRSPWSTPAPPPADGSDWSEDLDALVGLENVKDSVHRLRDFLEVESERAELGLPKNEFSLHQVFLGNPGTGKTSVARILAKIYRDFGFLSRAEVNEVDRSRLVGGFVGQTAEKTNVEIDNAENGVLFIDEAYSLADRGKDDFGVEAIDTLVKRMEDDRHKFVVIVAGYPARMETFLDSNPGLRARFVSQITFHDYSDDELGEIFRRRAGQFGYSMDEHVLPEVRAHLARLRRHRGDAFGNAREARTLWESALRCQSTRLVRMRADGVDIARADILSRLTADDVAAAAAAETSLARAA